MILLTGKQRGRELFKETQGMEGIASSSRAVLAVGQFRTNQEPIYKVNDVQSKESFSPPKSKTVLPNSGYLTFGSSRIDSSKTELTQRSETGDPSNHPGVGAHNNMPMQNPKVTSKAMTSSPTQSPEENSSSPSNSISELSFTKPTKCCKLTPAIPPKPKISLVSPEKGEASVPWTNDQSCERQLIGPSSHLQTVKKSPVIVRKVEFSSELARALAQRKTGGG